MVSADTNVIVRLLVGDDKAQLEKAKLLFAQDRIFIATSVVLECEWVLRYAYHFEPPAIANAFQTLFGIQNVTSQEPNVIADAIYLAASRQCRSLATFDRKFIKSAGKVTSFDVREP